MNRGGIACQGNALMSIGTAKRFNAQKGCGFMHPNGGGADIFVHIAAVERAGIGGMAEGQEISYDERRDPKCGQRSAEISTPA